MAASACGHLDFDSASDIWFHSHTFTCRTAALTGVTVSFWATFVKILLPCFLWGTGTAMGEIPPYALSRALREAGQLNAELDEELEEAGGQSGVIARMKAWMIGYIEKYGFWAVLALSAWPNAAFDLCGMCCGHFGMPFWTFFGGTFVGKALIKVNLQALLMVLIFSDAYAAPVLNFLKDKLPAAIGIALETQLQKTKDKLSAAEDEEQGMVQYAWSLLLTLVIGSFVVSCIHQFAQQKQKELAAKPKQE
jgi:membrane protein YqaA with SNARE-associated domain